ncbi:MAG: hypothetical protein AB7L71_13650 [Vicinamibacterales bacterium]
MKQIDEAAPALVGCVGVESLPEAPAHMAHRSVRPVLIGLLAAVLPLTAVASQPADLPAALSGGWKLNVDASVNPNGPEGAGARGRGNRSGPDRSPTLGIQATAKDVLLVFDPDPAKNMAAKYNTDNKKTTQETAAGPLEIKVKWEGKTALRREITTRESLKVVEDYTPSADGKQLVVTVKISATMTRIPVTEIKRVYDRVQ